LNNICLQQLIPYLFITDLLTHAKVEVETLTEREEDCSPNLERSQF
jgi:hypothetical protein